MAWLFRSRNVFAKRFIRDVRMGLCSKSGPAPKPAPKTMFDKLKPFVAATCIITGAGLSLWYYEVEDEIIHTNAKSSGTSVVERVPTLGGSWDMLNVDGETITDKYFHGKYPIYYFGFTFCPEVCPRQLTRLTRAVEVLDKRWDGTGKQVEPVFVSLDPKRDSPQQVKEYLKDFSPRITGVTGSISQVRKFAQLFKVFFSEPPEDDDDYLVDHSCYFFLMDKSGEHLKIIHSDLDYRKLANEIANVIGAEQDEVKF
eukprot:91698_1